MANFDNNILPGYSSWTRVNAAVSGTALSCQTNGTATWSKAVTDYTMSRYILISCAGCTGRFFLYFYYPDKTDSKYRVNHIAIPNSGLNLVLTPQEATVNKIFVQVICDEAGVIQPISMRLVELAIRSVDIEYAQNDSKTTPPTTGWQNTAPQFSTGKYIWQRTVTTFEDGTVAYSDPTNIQTSNTLAILDITDYYKLTNSNTTVPNYGEPYKAQWSTTCPTWSANYYIWTSSRMHWSDDSYTWTTPVLAKGLNDVNKKTYDVDKKVDALDKSLDAEGVFNRLTNNGQTQGLYFQDGKVYLNATYIKTGEILITTSTSTSSPVLFKASMTTRDVNIVGFTAYRPSSTVGYLSYNCAYFNDTKYGVYIGTDGISSGNGTYSLGMRYGKLIAEHKTLGECGAINFTRGFAGTNARGMYIEGTNHVAIDSPTFAIIHTGLWNDDSSTSYHYDGQTAQNSYVYDYSTNLSSISTYSVSYCFMFVEGGVEKVFTGSGLTVLTSAYHDVYVPSLRMATMRFVQGIMVTSGDHNY